MTTSQGRVIPLGDAPFLGDLSSQALRSPVTAIAPTPDDAGYYLVTADGGVHPFGRASHPLRRPTSAPAAFAVALVADPDGSGYWLAHDDGTVMTVDAPVREWATDSDVEPRYLVRDLEPFDDGYLMVAEDGHVLATAGSDPGESLRHDPPYSVFVAVGVAARASIGARRLGLR
jgi:hypothetical protein